MDRVVTPYEGSGHQPWDDEAAIPTPLRLHNTEVSQRWVDYNGHMSESCFLLVFGDNSDAFFRFIGIDEQYRAAGGSLYTVETHLHHRGEAALGDPLELSLQVLDHDHKRVHIYHAMHHGHSGALLASAEQMLINVDTERGGSAPLPDHLQQRIGAIAAAHRSAPAPATVGVPMGIRR